MFRCGCVSHPDMTNWQWFWWEGGTPLTAPWWYGFGSTWWGLFLLPLLAYVIARVVCIVRRHRIGSPGTDPVGQPRVPHLPASGGPPGMRVRTGRFRRGGQGCPWTHGMMRASHPEHSMLPIREALIGHLAHTGVIGANVLSVVECPLASSVLPDIESSGVLPARCAVIRPLLTSLQVAPSGSPQVPPEAGKKNALLPSATAAFTCPPEPCDFAVLPACRSLGAGRCQLVEACPAFYAISVRQPAGFR